MSEQWVTKFGPRRVRRDLPTLQEAIIAAEGITDDLDSQVEIAASLIGLAPESVRAEIASKRVETGSRSVSGKPGALRSVVVEYRSSGRRKPIHSP
jgi:hypothetical protein